MTKTEQREIELISKLTDREQFALLAYTLKEDAQMAYLISRPKPLKSTDASFYQQSRRFITSEPVTTYLNKLKRERTSGINAAIENGEISEEVTKDELLQELTRLFRTENDPKLKSEIGMKLADLKQVKKEQTEIEQQVKYYLPLPENEFIDYIKNRFKQDKAFAAEINKLINL